MEEEWEIVLDTLERLGAIEDRAVETAWICYEDDIQELVTIVRHKDKWGQDIPALDVIKIQDMLDGNWNEPEVMKHVYGYYDCHQTISELANGMCVQFYIGETVRALDMEDEFY